MFSGLLLSNATMLPIAETNKMMNKINKLYIVDFISYFISI